MDGNPLYPQRYSNLGFLNDDGISMAMKDGKAFHINRDGEPLYEERYDYVSYFSGEFSVVQKDGQWFHIGLDGKPLYEETFDDVWHFDSRYVTSTEILVAVAEKDGKQFHIGRNGKPLYKERYQTISNFTIDNTAVVSVGDDVFHIRLEGCDLTANDIVKEE